MSKKAFTLIELLVVIAIIALLSSIVLASLNDVRTKSRDTKRIRDFNELSKAIELYREIYGVYPCGDTFFGPNGSFDSTLSDSNNFINDAYINKDGNDCRNLKEINDNVKGIDDAGLYQSDGNPEYTQNGKAYIYSTNQERSKYVLYVQLEDNDQLMINDNGHCDLLYEVGSPGDFLKPNRFSKNDQDDRDYGFYQSDGGLITDTAKAKCNS